MKILSATKILFFVSLTLSCQDDSSRFIAIHDLPKWVDNPKNGFSKSRSIEGLILNVKLLPAELLASREVTIIDEPRQTEIDTIISNYKENLTFLLTIKPDEAKMSNQNLMYAGISGFAEYSNRVTLLNFRMHDYLLLKIGEMEYTPVLSSFENTFGLAEELKINIVFALNDLSAGLSAPSPIDFIFNDEIFNTGTNHFVFDPEEIINIPNIRFSKKVK